MEIRRILTMVALTAAFAASSPAQAQGKKQESGYEKGQGKFKGLKKGMGRRGDDMGLRGQAIQDIMQYLYPVELIRHYSTDLELADGQIKKIHKFMTEANDEVERLKWDLQKEAQMLVDLVKSGAAKDKIYVQMDGIFKIENKIKKRHMGLMLDVRDVLTSKQREFLDKVKSESRDGFPNMQGSFPPVETHRPPVPPGPPPPPPHNR